jgi:hypothetical protein
VAATFQGQVASVVTCSQRFRATGSAARWVVADHLRWPARRSEHHIASARAIEVAELLITVMTSKGMGALALAGA